MKNFSKFLILTLVLVNFLVLQRVKADTPTLSYSNIKAEAITDSSATISWDTNYFGTSFIAYGKWPFPQQDVGWGITLQECNMWAIHHVCYISFSGVPTGADIYYRIQSVNSDNPNNAFSSEYTFQTLAPFEISNLEVKNIAHDTATISWVSSLVGYSDVAYDTSPFAVDGLHVTTKQITNHASTTPTINHEIILIGLSPRTTYYYRVKSPDEKGTNDAYGSLEKFLTLDAPVQLQPITSILEPIEDNNEEAIVNAENEDDGVANNVDEIFEEETNKLAEQLFVNFEKSAVKNIDNELAKQLSGRILLQVEGRGEAWYVEPKTKQKYYLKNGDSALHIMRSFGQGITNADLRKIPIGVLKKYANLVDADADGLPDNLEKAIGTDFTKADSDADGYNDFVEVTNGFNALGSGKFYTDQNFSAVLKGRILLQVEAKGEAWYINPADGKRYFLADGATAYNVMRTLGLGITNGNLRQITVNSVNN